MSRSAKRVLITGASGQLGRELQARAPADWEVFACGSDECDITDAAVVNRVLSQKRPDTIIHAAAYTNVDAAEAETARAEAVNCGGAANVASAARAIEARMIYISTDFVFDGQQCHPYQPDDEPRPLNAYGRSKLAGEHEVTRISAGDALIVRTAWVYSRHGDNFVRRMLRLMAERESLAVVSDQIGTPTWGRTLAEALWIAAVRPSLRGILHWTDAGVASWYDFAVAIQEEALRVRALERAVPIRPIRSEELPRPARRPSYSILDKSAGWAALNGPAQHWRANLRSMLQEMAHA
jgi:dTDP-4-dehydrorhamnose reductase